MFRHTVNETGIRAGGENDGALCLRCLFNKPADFRAIRQEVRADIFAAMFVQPSFKMSLAAKNPEDQSRDRP